MLNGGEIFLQLFDEKQTIGIPHGLQLLDSRIQKLHEGEQDEELETTYCTSHTASIGENIVAIMNMSVSDDGYEQEEDSELWKTALKKIGWNVQTESDEFSMSIDLRIYDFNKKVILILDVMCPTEGIDFAKYNIDFQRPENVRDIANISFGENRCFDPDEEQKRFLAGVYIMMLRLIQPIGEHYRGDTSSTPVLIQ